MKSFLSLISSIFLLFCSVILWGVDSVQAEKISISSSDLSGNEATHHLNFSLPTFGEMKVSLTKTTSKSWTATFAGAGSKQILDNKDVTLFRGEGFLPEVAKTLPVAGSIFNLNGSPTLFLHFAIEKEVIGSGESQENIYEVRVPVTSAPVVTGLLFTRSGEDLYKTSCSTLAHIHEQGQMLTAAATTPTALPSGLKVVEMATDADKEYFDAYGVNTNTQIATIVNAADTIYTRDLNLSLQIKTQNVQTSSSQPYTATDASALLTQFRNHTNSVGHLGSADVYHLFTGKELDGSTVGIAYVGVVCHGTYAYGLTQKLSSTLDYIIFAHELGHNLDANHDASLPATVMYPSVSTSQTSFSATSASEIGAYVNGATCIGSAPTATPTATPTVTPTASPTPSPTATPTNSPTGTPTASPTGEPTASPTNVPTSEPTSVPTSEPTPEPRATPDAGDNIPSPETTTVRLRLKYSKAANSMDAQISVSGEKGISCKLGMEFSDTVTFDSKRGFTVSKRGISQARIRARFSSTVKKTTDRIYARATYRSCTSGGDTVYSETAQFIPYNKSNRRTFSATAWIRKNVRTGDIRLP